MKIDKNRIFFWSLICCLVIFSCLSVYFLKPEIEGDTPSYIEAIAVLDGEAFSSDFIPNRILTTFLGLESVLLLSKIFGSIFGAWFFLNLFFYFFISLIFYSLILKIFKSLKVALVTTLFFASNYSLLNFGLTYLMDIGGWTFYILSIYFTYQYLESGDYKKILWASLAIGIGGLFKEYAFLGCIPIAVVLIYKHFGNLIILVKKAFWPSVFALLPVSLVYFFIFKTFNYTYMDWLSFNGEYYIYPSRMVEYIKSFGSLYNFSEFLILSGIYCVIAHNKELLPEKKDRVFIIGLLLSVLPIFFWPAITQRILFITVPVVFLVLAFSIKRFEKYWWASFPILVLYIVSSFTMDFFILPNLNLPF